MPHGYRTIEACKLSGASYRQADYWSRCAILVPTIDAKGSGSSRMYVLREVQAMWVLAELSKLGTTPTNATARRAVASALLGVPEFSGYLVATAHTASTVAHVLELADLIAQLDGPVCILNLDRCPVQQEVLVT